MNYYKNTKGFSLIEVMIIMVVLIIIMVNFASLTKYEDRSAFQRQANGDMEAVVTEIEAYLSNSENCKNYLSTTDIFDLESNNTNITTKVNAPNIIAQKFYAAEIDVGGTYRDYNGTQSQQHRYGNSKVAIHSFTLSRKPVHVLNPYDQTWYTNTPYPSDVKKLLFTINFFKKTHSVWSPTNSNWIAKNLTLFASVTHTPTGPTYISKCFIGQGIDSCPTGMVMVGQPGTKGAYCIDLNRNSRNVSPTPANSPISFESAVSVCNTVGHLCTYSEWSKACLLRNNADAFYPAQSLASRIGESSSSWEWVLDVPTTTAMTTPSASNLLKVGATYSGNNVTLNPCITADRNTNPLATPAPALVSGCNCQTATNALVIPEANYQAQIVPACGSSTGWLAINMPTAYQGCLDGVSSTTGRTAAIAAVNATTACNNGAVTPDPNACAQIANLVSSGYRCCYP